MSSVIAVAVRGLVLVVALLGATACSGDSGLGGVPEGSYAADVEAFEVLSNDPSQLRANYLEARVLVGECMRSQGFEWDPDPVPDIGWWAEQGPAFKLLNPRYLFSMSIEDADSVGFGVAASYQQLRDDATFDPFPELELDGVDGVSSTEEFAYSVALFGSEGTSGAKPGCVAEAVERVDLTPPTADHDFEHALERVVGDRRFVSAMKHWEECMKSNGFDMGYQLVPGTVQEEFLRLAADELGTSVDELQESSDLSELRSLEQRVARQSVVCLEAERSEIDAVWTEVMSSSGTGL